MTFFEEFWVWLSALLAAYVGANTARIAGILEPAILAMGTLYLLGWGYLHLTGQIAEPFVTGLKRIAMLGLILGVALRLWLYNTVIVDTFLNAPAQLAAAVIGAFNPVTLIDQIMTRGSEAASVLLEKAGIFDGDWSFYLAGFAVYALVGVTAVYAMFLLALARIALSVLLALGPLFIAMLFFETTKRFVEAWLAQLANYAFVTILTVMVAALMLQLVEVAAAQAAARGDGIEIAEAVRVCLAAGLVLLVMRQVMPMAASLSHGLALSSMGAMSALIAWGWSRSTRQVGQFGRGAFLDRETSRWDSVSRKAGFQTRRAVGAGVRALNKLRLPNRLKEHES